MKFIFFSPFAAIWQHVFPEALVARGLKAKGHHITYIWCDEVFKRQCVAMSAYGHDWKSSLEDRSAICQRCQKNSHLIRSGFQFDSIPLSSLMGIIAKDIEDAIASVNKENYLDFQINNFPVGHVASYELFIKHKKVDASLSAEQLEELIIHIRQVLATSSAITSLLEQANYDRLLVYNGLYSANRAACLKAESKGVKSYFLHAGMNMKNRISTLLIGSGHQYNFVENLKNAWSHFKSHPCTQKQVALGFEHLQEIMQGKSVFAYSSAPEDCNIYDIFGIGEHQKVLVATMSSLDEYMGAVAAGIDDLEPSLLFHSQIDWVMALIAYIKDHPELFLIIRVHPREFPNKRENRLSEHALELKRSFVNLPKNICVNWPDDHISLYDIASEADLVLNGWSSVGEELSLLGIPVLSYSKKLLGYPADLNYFGETQEEYFHQLRLALDDDNALERIRMTCRWFTLKLDYASFDISDIFSPDDILNRSMLGKCVEKGRSVVMPDWREKRDIRRASMPLMEVDNIERLLSNGLSTPLDVCEIRSSSLDDETVYLRDILKKFMVQFNANCKLVKRLKTFMLTDE